MPVPEKIYFVDRGEELVENLHRYNFHTTTSQDDIGYILITKVKDLINKYIKDLEDAVMCDPDFDDPNYCLQDVEDVIQKMKNNII